MDRYLTELVGTFFLVVGIGMAVTSATPLAPIAIGATLVALVYMGGHVSGAHYNPAVTCAFYLRGRMAGRDVLPYVAVQLLGALAATGVVHYLAGSSFAPAPGPDVGPIEVLAAEMLFTFVLVLVILNVATATATEGNSYYGVAIGVTVSAGVFAVGPISGAALNPAVGTGPIVYNTLVGLGGLGDLWYYWVGPIVGAVLAWALFNVQNPHSDRSVATAS